MTPPDSRSIHKSGTADRAMLDTLAGKALAYLAADPDRLNRFFAETGLSPRDLRAAASRPDFAVSLLDHLATDEASFVGFAEENGYAPAALDALRRRLSPPDVEA